MVGFMEHWIETAGLCEISVHIYQTTWDHIPKDSNLYCHIIGIYLRMYVCTYIHTYIRTLHTYVHTCVHTHTHTHTHTNKSVYLATSFTYTPKTTKQCAMINAVLQIQET
jgi:hypothetical protein